MLQIIGKVNEVGLVELEKSFPSTTIKKLIFLGKCWDTKFIMVGTNYGTINAKIFFRKLEYGDSDAREASSTVL